MLAICMVSENPGPGEVGHHPGPGHAVHCGAGDRVHRRGRDHMARVATDVAVTNMGQST